MDAYHPFAVIIIQLNHTFLTEPGCCPPGNPWGGGGGKCPYPVGAGDGRSGAWPGRGEG